MFVFIYGFIGFTAYSSFSNWNKLKPDFTFVGFDNYIRLFKSQRFIIDMQNTFTFTLLFLAVTIVLGFFLAVILDQNIKGESIFRNIFLFPMALSYIVTGVVWRWLLAPGTEITGPLGVNILFDKMGLGFLKSGWYTDPDIGIKAVVIAATWQMAGYIMALYLAGMRAIPEELREAARVDGATAFEVYRYIVIPLLRPITLSSVIILGHISLKIFDLIVSMTGPGTGFSTDVPALFMFDTTFRGNRFAQGSSIAMVLLLLVALLVVPYLISSYRDEVER
jgi:glucose/mannose transport system permease protein